jgi:magnesium transporter
VLSVFQEITGVFGPGSLVDLPPDVIWIDLLNPTTEEIAFVESRKKVRIPSIEALSESSPPVDWLWTMMSSTSASRQ